ncbi:IS66-like element accessory protein TnpA [Asticcacaulis sp.]|uniref:IS66-like element accessory protein TnpA n=1 Tax=Asticcacaulis sp. TaxID=1872648 RepID=UPI002B8B365B|nr:transposase [Asticcacaulis sp.]HTM81968.1 transposase [Asticcacaulis sp.]
METTPEILIERTGPGGTRRSRRWPDEVKARLVAETLRPGVSVNEVARRTGVKANHLSSWRTLARRGKLILPAPEDDFEFSALVVSEPAPVAATHPAIRPEIVVGNVTIRLEDGASADRIAAVACAMMASV